MGNYGIGWCLLNLMPNDTKWACIYYNIDEVIKFRNNKWQFNLIMFKQEELLVLEVLAHETNSVKNDTQVVIY